MARGRIINSKITQDKRVNDLSDDTSRLAFTWLITFTDCEGRTYGDPALLRSILFPRRSDITVEQMEHYIREWESAELIKWYGANDDLWIEFPNFEKNQVGLRKSREPKSDIPPPLVDDSAEENRQSSDKEPEDIPLKRREEKLKEENTIDVVNLFEIYEENIGALTPMIAEQIKDWEEHYANSWVAEAVEIAVKNEIRKASYISGILKNWHTEGKGKKGVAPTSVANRPAVEWK